MVEEQGKEKEKKKKKKKNEASPAWSFARPTTTSPGFLRYASYKGVRTFVAGDFDNSGGGQGRSWRRSNSRRRRRKSGEKQREQQTNKRKQ